MAMQFVNLQRFDFGALRDFSRPREAANDDIELSQPIETVAQPAPPPPPTFTVEQLERERQSAHQQGYEKGIIDGMEKARKADADREAALITLMQQWNQLITTFKTDYMTLIGEKKQEVTKLSYEIARTVAQKALKDDSTALVQSLVIDCLPYLISEPILTLTIHPENAEKIKEWFGKIAVDYQYDGMLRIVEDTGMNATDGRLAWTNGDAETKQENIWQNIRQRLHVDNNDSALAATPEIAQDTPQPTSPEHPTE